MLKIYLPKSITSEFMTMRVKLVDTFFKVESIMKRNPQYPTLDNMKYILSTYSITLRPQLAQCQGISAILKLIRDNSSLDDISVLEHFINEAPWCVDSPADIHLSDNVLLVMPPKKKNQF